MPIDFPLDPKCSTYGYSFDNVCSGITHTISQNWRIMDDGAGTTFFAPVSTIASIGSDQGPDGQTGMTGMTGMTGNTGEVGATGPQGLTFTSTQEIKGMLFLPSSYGGDESEGVTLDASDTTIIGYNDGDSVEIGRAKEIFTASTSATVSSARRAPASGRPARSWRSCTAMCGWRQARSLLIRSDSMKTMV